MQTGSLGAIYEGAGRYCFITYQKEDAEQIRPIMGVLQRRYRFWYDSGAVSGRDWPEVVAQKIESADVFLVFLSRRAIHSGTVRREIHYAAIHDVTIICVFLEDCELSAGLAMQTESATVIRRSLLKSDRDAANEIMKVLPAYVKKSSSGRETDLADRQGTYKWAYALSGVLCGVILGGFLGNRMPSHSLPFALPGAPGRGAAEKQMNAGYADLLEDMPEEGRYFLLRDMNGDGFKELAAGEITHDGDNLFYVKEVYGAKAEGTGKKTGNPVLLMGVRDGHWYEGSGIDPGDLQKNPENYVRSQITEDAFRTAVCEILPHEVTVYPATEKNAELVREGKMPDPEEGVSCIVPEREEKQQETVE